MISIFCCLESSDEVESLCNFDDAGSEYIPSSDDSAPVIGFVSVLIDESNEEIILLSPSNTNSLCNEIHDENSDTEDNEETSSIFSTNNDINEILYFSNDNNNNNNNLSLFDENNDASGAQKSAPLKKKRKYKNKKTFCFYCETDVSNFSRHLFRNHESEKEVQEILAIPKKDPLRATSIQNLRKLGSFTIHRPVRNTAHIANAQLLPCTFCKGYYIEKSLRFHVRKCKMNDRSKKCRPQSNG